MQVEGIGLIYRVYEASLEERIDVLTGTGEVRGGVEEGNVYKNFFGRLYKRTKQEGPEFYVVCLIGVYIPVFMGFRRWSVTHTGNSQSSKYYTRYTQGVFAIVVWVSASEGTRWK